MFVNAESPVTVKLAAAGSHKTIYLPAESTFMGRSRPEMNIDRDGAEKLVKEAAERHNVDPALVRAVIQTESNWSFGLFPQGSWRTDAVDSDDGTTVRCK